MQKHRRGEKTNRELNTFKGELEKHSSSANYTHAACALTKTTQLHSTCIGLKEIH